MVVGLLDRLAREEIGLQAQLARTAHEREGVGQREEDEVVLPVGARQEGAPVINVRRHPRVGVRLVGVLFDADLLDTRIDLDRVDALSATRERERHIGACSRADDQHVAQGIVGSPLVGLAVERLELQALFGIEDVLVRDAIDLDRRVGRGRSIGVVLGRHLVVRRPGDARREGLDDEEHNDSHRRQPRGCGQGSAIEQHERDQHDRRPDPRR